MSKDLEIIKELEGEIGCSLPKRSLGEMLPNDRKSEVDSVTYANSAAWPAYGFFVDDGNNVVSLALVTLDLKEIPSALLKLKNLKILNLGANDITAIPYEITELSKLEKLQFIYNSITEIKPFLLKLGLPIIGEGDSSRLLKKKWIDLSNNNIKSPPPEIVNQGNEALRNYFAQIEEAQGEIQYLFEAKLLIIGDGGTGKSSFKRKIMDVNAEMPAEKDTTLGIEVDQWSYPIQFSQHPELGTVQFHVNLWDFGGQKIYRGTHQIFFTDKAYYVLVADTREQGTNFSYWLNTVSQLSDDNSRVLILLNKKFGHEVKFDETGFRGHFGKIIKDVFELDLKNDTAKICELQDMVKLHLKQLPDIGDPLPPPWVRIREVLLRETDNFITFDRFRELCANHGITDPGIIRTLSGYFSRIGAFTHYIDDPVLQERIYLNSNWLVNTVYEVLDNERAKKKNGRLDEKDIDAIWQTTDLNFEIAKLTQLMHNFGLMYHIPGSKNYVVPEHLPMDQPYEAWDHESSSDILPFIYEFDKYMPLGLMSRLIVSLHRHIDNHDRVWHRGFNLELKGTHAEIIETYGSANTFEIRITGPNKIELLAIIRERFAEVLGPFRNLNYQQLVPCTCNECTVASHPCFHDYNSLLNLRGKGTGSQCRKSGELVDVSELLRITEFIQGEDEEVGDDASFDHSTLKTVKLFLASSSELKTDREQVEIWVNRENKKLVKKGVFLQFNLWEDFLDAMSRTRMQDEYNKVVAQSDIFISLFATKVGQYTEEEFEIAHQSFKKVGKPKYIYTFFKDVQLNLSEVDMEDFMSLNSFKKKLSSLGHFHTSYKSIQDLNGQLKNQLDVIIEDMS